MAQHKSEHTDRPRRYRTACHFSNHGLRSVRTKNGSRKGMPMESTCAMTATWWILHNLHFDRSNSSTNHPVARKIMFSFTDCCAFTISTKQHFLHMFQNKSFPRKAKEMCSLNCWNSFNMNQMPDICINSSNSWLRKGKLLKYDKVCLCNRRQFKRIERFSLH